MDALSALEYPHWLIVAGSALAVIGFIGFAFRQKQERVGQRVWHGEYTPTKRLEAMRESASVSADSQRKAKGKMTARFPN